MAEETIYCPSCNHKLRVPEEMLGQPVQCPLCRAVFVAPVRGPAAPAEPPMVLPVSGPAVPPPPVPVRPFRPPVPPEQGDLEGIYLQVRSRAVALIVVGFLGWLSNAYAALHVKMLGVDGVYHEYERQQQQLRQLGFPAGREAEALMTPEFVYGFQLGVAVLLLILCTGVLVGASQMLRLRHYGLALLGSVLVMLNLQGGCCLIGIPVGIWSLTLLMRPEVRRAFE